MAPPSLLSHLHSDGAHSSGTTIIPSLNGSHGLHMSLSFCFPHRLFSHNSRRDAQTHRGLLTLTTVQVFPFQRHFGEMLQQSARHQLSQSLVIPSFLVPFLPPVRYPGLSAPLMCHTVLNIGVLTCVFPCAFASPLPFSFVRV